MIRRLLMAIAMAGSLFCNSPVNHSNAPLLGPIEFGREYSYRLIEHFGQEIDTASGLTHLGMNTIKLPNGNDSLVAWDSTNDFVDTSYYEQSDTILRLTKYVPGRLSSILSKRAAPVDDQLPAILLYNLIQDQPVTSSHSVNGQEYLTTMTYIGNRSISVPAGDFLCHVVKSTNAFGMERFYYFDKHGIVKKEEYSKISVGGMDSLGTLIAADSLVDMSRFFELVSFKK